MNCEHINKENLKYYFPLWFSLFEVFLVSHLDVFGVNLCVKFYFFYGETL